MADVGHDVVQRLMMKGRLHQGPLLAPWLELRSEQALPRDQGEGSVLDGVLVVIPAPTDQDASNGFRIVDEVARWLRDRELHHIAVGLPGIQEELHGIAANAADGAHHVRAGRAGRGRGGSEVTTIRWLVHEVMRCSVTMTRTRLVTWATESAATA